MFPTVSVVVSIYKVEKYLNRCIDSIINQTYTNLEIILVNDGSPDKCGYICEQYALKDRRIKVVHKENGGLSDARNYGMKYVSGLYTVFIDSDDWLELNMIENMIKLIDEYNADIVQVGFYYAYKDYLLYDDRYYCENDKPVVLDNYSLMKELVHNEKVKNFAWGKLYKTDLIKDIPFKKGVLFEDVFWAHQVMQRVNKYVLSNKPLCYYLQREDSIVATYTTRNLDIIEGLKERHEFIEKYYNSLSHESYKLILRTSLLHYNLLLRNKDKDKEKIHRKNIQNYIKKNYKKLYKATLEDGELRLKLKLFNVYPGLNLLSDIINKILRVIKIKQEPKELRKIELSNREGVSL